MKLKKISITRRCAAFVAFTIAMASSHFSHGQEEAPIEGPELPGTLDPGNHFTALKQASPFLRELNFSETYAIRAVATIGETPVATLYNRNTKKTHMIFPGEKNEIGLELVEIAEDENPLAVTIKVAFAGDVFEVKYDEAQTSVAPKSSGGSSKSGGKDGERKGPSKEDIDRYKSLNDEQKKKFRDYIQYTMKKYPNISREERGNLIRGAMMRLVDGRELSYDK